MRMRTLAAAAIAAAGLSVALTGAASAATAEEPPPPGEAVIVTCVNGEATVRPATEEDRKRIEEMRSRFDGEPVVKEGTGDGPRRVIKIAPPGAEPGEVGPPGAKPGEKLEAMCAAGGPAAP